MAALSPSLSGIFLSDISLFPPPLTKLWQANVSEQVEKLVASTLSKSLTEREEKLKAGEFQPLSYWSRLGYGADLITQNTPPTHAHDASATW